MDFYKQILTSHHHELVPLRGSLSNSSQCVCQEVMEFYDTIMKKSWNFVTKISRQPCVISIRSHCIYAYHRLETVGTLGHDHSPKPLFSVSL